MSRKGANGSALWTRLGIDQPAGWWPAIARLKSYEAAGFRYTQVRMPPRGVLSEPALAVRHACTLRERFELTGLRLILHAPDDLLAGSTEHDQQFRGALRYARLAGAEIVVYHGARLPVAMRGVRTRLEAEARSLRRLVPAAEDGGIRIAIENLAPVYPGPPHVCHDPAAVAELAHSLDSDHVGVCLDLGHAHIVASIARRPLLELIEPALPHAILFHVHDNFGARVKAECAGQVEPLRLDLHLPPGAGCVPWETLAPRLARHRAPVQLEIHPAGRPEPGTLAVLAREVLGLGEGGVVAAR
ncbi:MAG TPA: sugar phosphate isomerase/epimerase [Solirubrobacteraceae bacterium]|jgi:sugar phosphate isomerase/epimerase